MQLYTLMTHWDGGGAHRGADEPIWTKFSEALEAELASGGFV